MFDKLVQVLRFGCSREGIAGISCSAGTVRDRRDEWITLGMFAQLKTVVLDIYDLDSGYDSSYDSGKTREELAGRGM